jgi:Transposase DDE domain
MSPEAKKTYRIHNWGEYNKALTRRGSITFWFSQDAIDKWHPSENSKKNGRPHIYSDEAILCALLVRTVYNLPLRATQGFLISLVVLLRLVIKIPSYSQISRRAKALEKTLKKLNRKCIRHIVFDSTGLKVYGEGEWKVRKHGKSKRRTWRKLHVGMDPDSGEIVVSELTDNGCGSGDSEVGKRLLNQISKGVKKIWGDGAYDDIDFRRTAKDKGAKVIVPPPRNAVLQAEKDAATTERNDYIKQMVGLGNDEEARALWKKLVSYHVRSNSETTMYRIKQLTGNTLRSRTMEAQRTEAYIKCMIINKMTKLGMPDSSWGVAA